MIEKQELNIILREISLLNFLTEEEMDEIILCGVLKEVDKGEIIFYEGDQANQINLLLKGVVKISKESDGREVLKSIQHPRTILDDLCISCETVRTSNAIVLSPMAVVFSVECSLMRRIISENKELTIGLIQYMGRKLKYAEERLESFVLNDARERIVEFLKVNAEAFGQSIGFEMLLKHNFTQQDIANYTGTSRQTVTMVLNDLKKTNKIHFKRQSILIRDLKALA
jgi:CRP/FNR family cyclic AMP-dependent transcriptional regulator